ncbi:MAG: 3'-5' exonuclease, partial [Candidatus Aenigmatarchaeota archaeon]
IMIFCKNAQGESVCVFYEKFLPYFYLYGDEKKYDDVIAQLKKKYVNLKFEIIEKILPIGYQKPSKVLKIIGTEPGQTPEIREFVKSFGTPYEADILFKYRFMSDFDLRGMSWIEVDGKLAKTATVKCKAVIADTIKPIEILKNAPLRYMTLDIECLPEEPRIPIPEKDKIIAISMSFCPEYKGKDHMIILAKHARFTSSDNVIACANEKDMLQKFKDVMDDYDPDIVGGYNINNFDLPFILGRMEVNKIQRDLGKSEKIVIARKLQQTYMTNICGRVIVDAFEIIKKDPWVKFKRYDLNTVSMQMLGIGKIDLGSNTLEKIKELWNKSDLHELIEYSKRDSELVLKLLIEKRLLDKFFEIAKVCGLLMQDCLGGQSQRHEFRLLKEFYKRNFIMPCKPDNVGDRVKDHNLKGAFVLEPEVGFHEWIICLDFTSMYPSLIRAFNICTTTLLTNGEDADHIVTPLGAKFVKPNVFKGILPILVDEFLGARVSVKKLMDLETDPENKRILKAKNLALKDLSNSVHHSTDVVVKDPAGKLEVLEIGGLFEKLAKSNEIKNLNEDIEVIELNGWETLSVDGTSSCFKPMYAISRHRNKSKLIKVRTKMGEVQVTPGHSIIEMKGKPSNRVREGFFNELIEVKGSEVKSETIIAQVNNVHIDGKSNQRLNLIDFLLSCPDEEIMDMSLFVPQSLNLNKHNWLKNRADIFKYVREGPASSKLLRKNFGFDHRLVRDSAGLGMRTLGKIGHSDVYDLTEEGEKYISFYEVFKDAKETPDHYEIPLTRLRGLELPERILLNSKIASHGGKARRKMNAVVPITKELAELFGWYVSEGSSTRTTKGHMNSYKASIENFDQGVLDRLV